jgi:hypothetical protein
MGRTAKKATAEDSLPLPFQFRAALNRDVVGRAPGSDDRVPACREQGALGSARKNVDFDDGRGALAPSEAGHGLDRRASQQLATVETPDSVRLSHATVD